ncbi:MAG: hypothetical protein KJ767_00895 [Nanoarchaeota archaeon]|nr:hypothetical protein [Nanoarchaeota archaeon]
MEEKDLECKIIEVLERYYNGGVTLARVSEDVNVSRYDVIQFMIEYKLSPETRSPIKERNLEKLEEIKSKVYV